MKNLIRNLFIFLLIFLVIASIFSLFNIRSKKTEEINLDQLVKQINEEKIKSIVVEDAKLTITTIEDQEQIAYKEEKETLSDLFENYQIPLEKRAKISVTVKSGSGKNVWLTIILPLLIPLLFIIGFFYFMMRQIRGASNRALTFGQVKAKQGGMKNKKVQVTFKDVAGIKEAKEEIMEVVEFLRSPRKFTAVGAKIPKGVLLLGPPGTGKTLLARAVAGEAKVPFFHISGSEFVEMFVGVGASRVRSLFDKAKKEVPCIVFIDELDAVGRQRGAGLGGSHDEREQTLNQILVEMDGFEPNLGLVVLAATNRPDILDPALLRPGRFDRRIILDMPDIKDRAEILKIHAQGKPFSDSVSLKKIAERTPGFSGADLANLLNEAAILTARRGKGKIGMSEILESVEKVMLGPERKSHLLSEKERKITAYHEAGHALVAHLLPHCDPVQKVSIIARGMAAGYTLKIPEKDKYLHTKSEFTDNLAAFLGGYAAEKAKFGEVTTGAANDLKQATALARKLVTKYGMSSLLGPRTFGLKEELIFLGREISERRDYSEETARLIDKEVSKFITSAYQQAQKIIKTNKKSLEKIAKLLLKKETLERPEFERLFK
jgi:cell division protease FtsH